MACFHDVFFVFSFCTGVAESCFHHYHIRTSKTLIYFAHVALINDFVNETTVVLRLM